MAEIEAVRMGLVLVGLGGDPVSKVVEPAAEVYADDFDDPSLAGFWDVKQAVPGVSGYLDDANSRYVITTDAVNLTGSIYLDNDEDGGSGFPGIPVDPSYWKITADMTHQNVGGADGDITWIYAYCRNIDDGSPNGMGATDRGLAMILNHYSNTLAIHDYAGFSGAAGSKASKSFPFGGTRTDVIEFEYTGSEVNLYFNEVLELSWASGPLSFPGAGRDTRRSFQVRGWNGGGAAMLRALNYVQFEAIW